MRKKLLKRSMAFVLMLMVLSTGLVASAEGTYTVEKGDYLKKIAQSEYGDSARWEDIYEANKDSIKNPNILYRGQVLILPDIAVIPTENPEDVLPAETPEETIPAEAPEGSAAADTAMTLEQWTVSEECSEIEIELNEMLQEMGLNFVLKADGNILVFEYTFLPEMWGDVTAEELAEYLKDTDFTAFLEDEMWDELKQEFDATYGIKLDGIRNVFIASDGRTVYSADLD